MFNSLTQTIVESYEMSILGLNNKHLFDYMHFRGKLGGSPCDGFHNLQTSKKGICFIASARQDEKYQTKVVAAIERRLGSGRTAVGHRQRPHWSVKCYINYL